MPVQRQADYTIHPQFIERFSPRAFKADPVPQETLHRIFEAARWAPSCFNEQPWLVLYATTPEDLDLFRPLLVDMNRAWADAAPVVGFVFAKKHFAMNGHLNAWAPFDAGQAALSIALQAHLLNVASHFMGGIHKDAVYGALGVDPEKYEVMAGFVLGYEGDPATLPEKLREREVPSPRHPQAAQFIEGRFPAS